MPLTQPVRPGLRTLEEENDAMRITLRIAFHELATKLADVEEGFADHDARLPLSASDDVDVDVDVDAEVRKAMDVLEGIEDVGGGAVARGEPPRLLDDLA